MSFISDLFKTPKSPSLPPPPKAEKPIVFEEPEPVTTVTEDASDAARKEKRRRALAKGRSSTIGAGIENALKQRLGE